MTLPYTSPVVDMALPGAELIAKGLEDLRLGRESVEAFLVSIGAPRLKALGLDVVGTIPEAEHRLFDRLSESDATTAHSRYNALLRRLVSFERAACARP